MKKAELVILLVADLVILGRVAWHGELVLLFVLLLGQAFVWAGLSVFDRRKSSATVGITKKSALTMLAITLFVLPLLVLKVTSSEPTAWNEVGVLLRGPSAVVFWLLGLVSVTVAVLGSLYLRRSHGRS